MASILSEYVQKGWGIEDYKNELQALISKYNAHTGRYMFVYASDINKSRNADVSLVQEDFYNIQDILRECDKNKIDLYIETPGGSGEAAEEIALFLRKNFEEVNFVIAGEAKSAGTILALSGDNIYMTETGSLGPIDAQVRIGRSTVSAHDYKSWVEEKREEAQKVGRLNPFDAIMVAQISPGELYGVINSLEFAKDLVKDWLENHKFKNWIQTESSKKEVTPEMKKKRAEEVADKLCDHTEWRTHGRSLKIEDLKDLLLIERIDDDPTLSDIVYRIKTVIRIIFDTSTNYKIFYLDNFRIGKTFSLSNGLPMPEPKKNIQPISVNCSKCGKKHPIAAHLGSSNEETKTNGVKKNPNIQEDNTLICDQCKLVIDLKPIKNQLEEKTKQVVTFS